ncbi:hypothetical protein G1K52_11810 [Tenacibaculum finnmarkense]|uniref:hypothetical protein n=1 Tax=Tenacibaculum finnmarkense TaxID=2781243 RepID=UPI001E3AE4AC|nr:hypothetical protein [Tenacibaculum finnmarkense]MCD8401441.1 hypothetical protein [Tenacibaculum finnmarkense genomovar ulcerans]MCG8786445.1 hypothetical protein [Tenacibaculum finnmarkense]
MFKFKKNTKTFRDETAGYCVILSKDYTVGSFVEEVLTYKNEWGYIGVDSGAIFGSPNCEFKNGVLIGNLPNDIMCKKIISVRANGGWSRMDYLLTIS